MSVSNKGFSMLEMLVSMLVVSAMLLISLRKTSSVNLEHYYFLDDYLFTQSKAMLEKTDESLSHGVSFNSMGRVNQARTIEFNNHQVIVHLGNGYVSYQ